MSSLSDVPSDNSDHKNEKTNEEGVNWNHQLSWLLARLNTEIKFEIPNINNNDNDNSSSHDLMTDVLMVFLSDQKRSF